jgi:hypothetical protein
MYIPACKLTVLYLPASTEKFSKVIFSEKPGMVSIHLPKEFHVMYSHFETQAAMGIKTWNSQIESKTATIT